MISQDDDSYFLHYYIQKGFTIEYLMGLGTEKKCFYMASMIKALEDKRSVLKR